MKLFGLERGSELCKRIARHARVPLAAHEERTFDDGEFEVRPAEDVRGEAVYVVSSLHGDDGYSVSDKLCRLLFFVGALRDAGAREVIAVVPYLAFARQDRRTAPGDPVTSRYVASLLEAAGVRGVAVVDVHNRAAFENAFRGPKWHFSAAPLFVEHFRAVAAQQERVVVLSPDTGGIDRAHAIGERLEPAMRGPVDVALIEKRRGHQVGSPADPFAGDVESGFVIVVDDLVSSGVTLARAVDACRRRGALAVHAAVTHGIFSAGAERALRRADLDSLVITDTVSDARARAPYLGDRLQVLDCAVLFRDLIRE